MQEEKEVKMAVLEFLEGKKAQTLESIVDGVNGLLRKWGYSLKLDEDVVRTQLVKMRDEVKCEYRSKMLQDGNLLHYPVYSKRSLASRIAYRVLSRIFFSV